MLANAELLDRLNDPEIRVLTGDIRAAARRGADLTRQVLTAARKQALEPRPIRLAALLADMEPLLRRLIPNHITLTVQPGDSDPVVLAAAHAVGVRRG